MFNSAFVFDIKKYLLSLCALKGKLRDFFLLAQSFYWPQTKTSLKMQFSRKSPWVGQKSMVLLALVFSTVPKFWRKIVQTDGIIVNEQCWKPGLDGFVFIISSEDPRYMQVINNLLCVGVISNFATGSLSSLFYYRYQYWYKDCLVRFDVGLQWAIPGCTWLQWAVLGNRGFTALHRAVMDCTGLYLAELDFAVLYWSSLDVTERYS